MPVSSAPRTRRETIADAAIRIIARDGVRALTHRAVDREAELPQGSTSYHAKTRRALLELIVDALASHTLRDTVGLAVQSDAAHEFDITQLAMLVAGLVDTLAARRDDMRARYALILELDDMPHLRQRLTSQSEVQTITRAVTSQALASAGLPHSLADVDELLALTDALVFYRTAINEKASSHSAILKYLRGAASS
ncbi:TetR/AcrR family transcriptional regulator [Gordonia sp. CPCC 205333]|uniref:TetR/AcrR family transcriptional regulator n=1 Tax=Gordonia sp. CPCC 205333 TaxID=3140790 RepID=UPI003AF3825C